MKKHLCVLRCSDEPPWPQRVGPESLGAFWSWPGWQQGTVAVPLPGVSCARRVQFRRALLEKRLQEKKALALLQARQQEEKEKRLEALRQQVGWPWGSQHCAGTRCQAGREKRTLSQKQIKEQEKEESLEFQELWVLQNFEAAGLDTGAHVAIGAKLDPARAVADTVASKARMGIGTSDEFELQQPLFRLHTYSEEQTGLVLLELQYVIPTSTSLCSFPELQGLWIMCPVLVSSSSGHWGGFVFMRKGISFLEDRCGQE
ncbi:hypothetical protein DV515_00014305 [Chloebia gouldiae]|uniref:Uncharacterized protein n=1 Tax=Chloebia gouldiae TaxID=44316 RepID=A0A3L8RYN4_CHLGU|nr:hypothetical protein DV515_00014305 [Chloebia gouldiae]